MRYRLDGGGRKVQYIKEGKVAERVLSQREKSLRVTYKYIAEKAKEIINDPNFNASQGWIIGFIDHRGFSLRKKTTVGQRLPSDLTSKVISFICRCKTCIKSSSIVPSCIGNMLFGMTCAANIRV